MLYHGVIFTPLLYFRGMYESYENVTKDIFTAFVKTCYCFLVPGFSKFPNDIVNVIIENILLCDQRWGKFITNVIY